MLMLRKPTRHQIDQFLADQAEAPLAYDNVGATTTSLPKGWRAAHHRVRIGSGEADFAAAVEAVRHWRMFPPEVAEVSPADAPLVPGTVVAPLLWAPGFWALVGCRIVYVVDESDTDEGVSRFGFAYGTLASHVERGEERFLVEWRHDEDTVWYDLRAFSRHGTWLTRLGHPLVRALQRRFIRRSAAAMLAAVAEARSELSA